MTLRTRISLCAWTCWPRKGTARSSAHEQLVALMNALPAADDLAVPFRGQHVHAQSEIRVLRVILHVERLQGRRIAVDDHRAVELVGEDRLLVPAAVVTRFGRGAFLLLPFH